ncbi:unnamed protein product [Heligmosomoides polygyrus]|uniref:Reverse transcriptase domain-containing protein n=1 Tax=Heligmosomoides polygyrus TaxID=6339 RepID=A0A183G7H4_HELPZ|nr:unnamed protein product [Heligmosomoides polygyrus]
MGVKTDGQLLHHLRFADDIVLLTPSIGQTVAERQASPAGFPGCQENTKTPTQALVGLLRESSERMT